MILSGNGQSGLVWVGVMRVSASMPSVSVTAEASTLRLRRDRAGRLQFQPQRRQSTTWRRCLAAGSSGRPWPIAPARSARRWDRCGSVACTALIWSATVLSISGLTCAGTLTRAPATERLVSPRLTCARQIRLDVPGRGELRPRGDGDVALDLGAGVERLDVDAADLLGDIAAEQAAERVADRAGRLRRQRARDVEFSGQRRRQRQHVLSRRSPRSVRARRSSRCRRSAGSATPDCRPCRRNCAARRDRRRRESRDSAIATGARMTELRETGGSGGNSTSSRRRGSWPRGDSQSIAFRLTKNETATTAIASRDRLASLGPTGSGRRIVPPD